MPTMSKLVDELQVQGLVIRAQSKDDARQRWIVPTQKGINELAAAEAINSEFWRQRFADLKDAELVSLEQSLERLIDRLQPK